MGSNTSKLSPPAEKLINERLEALHIKESEEEEYIHVHEDEKNPGNLGGEGKSLKAPWTPLSVSAVGEWETELLKDAKNRLAITALSTASPRTLLLSPSSLLSTPQLFNNIIPFEGSPITNQRQSGRCWLFAATNVFRVAIMKRYGLKDFELSQGYLFFWDKLEKANWFLEEIIETAGWDVEGEGVQGRTVKELLKSPVGDGGQWDMVYNLVTKYGLVPQSLYPDTFNISSSSAINSLITTKLREDALILRSLATSSSTTPSILSAAKEKMMREIHLILTLAFGPPPSPKENFVWEYTDKDSKYHSLTTSPLKFAEDLNSPASVSLTKTKISSMFSLVNDPRHPYYTLLTVDRLGNIVGGRGITYVNVPMEVMKEAAIKMLKEGLPVFFGSDVGKFSDSEKGIMVEGLVDYELGFNVKLGLGKADRLRVGESAMTHAMVLTGVHLSPSTTSSTPTPQRWRVQNSWGTTAGKEGWFVASDKWMDEYTFQIVVEPRFVSKEVRDVLKGEAKVLPLWDPMGALA